MKTKINTNILILIDSFYLKKKTRTIKRQLRKTLMSQRKHGLDTESTVLDLPFQTRPIPKIPLGNENDRLMKQ